MSRKKILKKDQIRHFTPTSVGDRINYIIAKQNLTSTAFSRLIGISTGNLNGLVNDDNKPSSKFLTRILELFNININWLLTGNGSKYIKPDGQERDEDPEIADLLERAKRVLTSGNPVAFDALERNIRYFDHVVATEKRLRETEDRMKKLENDMEAVQAALKTQPEGENLTQV